MGVKSAATALAVILTGGLPVACKSLDLGGSGAAKGPGIRDGEMDVIPQPPGDDPARVPANLWSPSQRVATASTYFLTAEYVALKERDARKALQLFEAAYSLDPNPFLGGRMLAAKAAAGDRAEAMLDGRRMVLLYPREPRLRLFYGDMLAQAGQPLAAAEQLEKCIELDPKSEPAYLELTEVYQGTKQPGKALAVAKELVRHIPGSVAGWSLLSRLYLINGQHKDAVLPARRAWEMQSTNPQLAQIYAIALQLTGRTRQAVQIYEQLYRLNPADEELMGRMVDLYRQLGNLESAVELLDEMVKQGGPNTRPAVQMQKAVLLWELKRNREAAALLDDLVKAYPDSDRIRYLAAYGHERMDHHEQALVLYRSIPANSPLRKDATLRTIGILRDLKRMAEAIAIAESLLNEEGAPWETYGIVVGVYGDALRYRDAIRIAERGYARFPDKPRLLFLKGVYQEKAGDRDGSIATMRQVIKEDPDNSSAYNFLGYLFAEKGEHLDEAERLITQALTLKPNDGFYLDSLGWLYFQKGRFDKALETLERAAKIEPKEGVIYEHIGDVKKAKGDAKSAHDYYERALRETLEPQDRARIEKKAKGGLT